jgi:UDP-N-acetylmuramyl pentapeptide phosphotransferase/UDP-N-acetylglucosamine-1-phosphate transferase
VTRLAVALAVGIVGGRLVWMTCRPIFAAPALTATNWRGRAVPTAAGVLLPLVAMVADAGRVLLGAFGVGSAGTTPARLAVLVTVTGFALLGALDDVAGTAAQRGFRGHLGALARGRLTTGSLKLIGGAVLAVAVAGSLLGREPLRLAVDAALIALCANAANLFDRAPGRVVKVGGAAFVVVVAVAGLRARLDATAVVVGAVLGLAVDDLRERLMLGDAGANALGAVLGLGLVMSARPLVRSLALVVVIALNVAGELVSFSRVIEAVPPLRAIDRAGRLP